jgi:hypothetical protein
MLLIALRYSLALSLLGLTFLVACGEGSSERSPVEIINVNFDGGDGCVQPTFPSDQPDLFVLQPPRFQLTNSISQNSTAGQAQVDPGEAIEAEIAVNSATRGVRIELVNAWTPQQVIYTEDVATAGNEVIDVVMFSTNPNTRGRFYMRLTLCGFDCRETQVVYDIVECENPNDLCGVNVPYERTLFEDGEIVRVDGTCIDLTSDPGIGSGTVVIQ